MALLLLGFFSLKKKKDASYALTNDINTIVHGIRREDKTYAAAPGLLYNSTHFLRQWAPYATHNTKNHLDGYFRYNWFQEKDQPLLLFNKFNRRQTDI